MHSSDRDKLLIIFMQLSTTLLASAANNGYLLPTIQLAIPLDR